MNPDGTVARESLLEEIAHTFRPERVISVYEKMVRNEFLAQQASEDALISRPKEGKRATLMIAPFWEGAAITFAEIAKKQDETNEKGKIVRRRDRVCTYGRYWDVDIAMGVKDISVMDGFYENLNIESLKDFIDHGCDLPRIPVGIQLSFAVGQALRQKILKDGFFVVWVFFGDGATAQGYFHEALNVASILKLPVIFVCRNNNWAISTRQHETTATQTYAEKALAYQMAFLRADGNDMFATYLVYKLAYEYVEQHGEPILIELLAYRGWFHTTAVNLNPLDVPREELERTRLEAPLRRTRLFLCSPEAKKYFGIHRTREEELAFYLQIAGRKLFELARSQQWREVLSLDWITEEDEKRYRKEHIPQGEVQKTTESSYKGSLISLKRRAEFIARWEKLNTEPLYESSFPDDVEPKLPLPEKLEGATSLDSIGIAHYILLARDRRHFVAGEDVAPGGGVMRATSLRKDVALQLFPHLKHRVLTGFLPLKEIVTFSDRIINTPLCENAIVGIFGMGAAQNGLRPIVEIQFDEFVMLAADQIQEAAKEIQMKGGITVLPMIIRLPSGGGRRIGWHQYCSMARFTNLPGIIIATWATVQDAFDITLAASRANRPVLLYEPIELYRPEFFLRRLGWYRYDSETGKEFFAPPAKPLKGDLIIRQPWQPIESFGARIAKEGRSKEETGGKSITIIAFGSMVYKALKAAELIERIERGSSVEVLDLRLIKPLDFASIAKSVAKTGRLVVAEESPKLFGIGAEILGSVFESKELFLKHLEAQAKRVASPEVHFLHSKYVESIIPGHKEIVKTALEILRE